MQYVFSVIKKTIQSKQSPNGRKFAQSGHPACMADYLNDANITYILLTVLAIACFHWLFPEWFVASFISPINER
jgi:hypothetical protein